jgi:hypothetical protein
MLKEYTRIITILILVFHYFIFGLTFYSSFSDYSEWSIYTYKPFFILIFALVWTGISLGKRWCALLYFSLLFMELTMKLFFGHTIFGNEFGNIMYPCDLGFSFIILLLYKSIFRSPADAESNK